MMNEDNAHIVDFAFSDVIQVNVLEKPIDNIEDKDRGEETNGSN